MWPCTLGKSAFFRPHEIEIDFSSINVGMAQPFLNRRQWHALGQIVDSKGVA